MLDALPVKVAVTFMLPGYGVHKEQYSMFSAEDCACWKANAKVYPQLSVVPVESVDASAWKPRRLRAYHRLLRMVNRRAQRLNVSLRSGHA